MALNVGELYASFGIDNKGLDKQISAIEKKCSSMGKSFALLGAGMTAAITGPLIKIGKSIFESGTNFEEQMSRVEAISGASGKSLADLTSKALEMGSTTKFTATEAGKALEYMAMAGWKDQSMLAGIEPIMNLAAASGEDLAHTSDIVTDAMTAFGYTLDSVGGDVGKFNGLITHFSDVLAATATNANTNVAQMGEAFKYVAPLAGTMGYSIDDIAIALGTMANAGIKGSQAGTSLQRMMTNMIKPTKQQNKAMKALGLSLYDSNGKIKSWSEVMGDMRKTAKTSGIDMKKLQKEVGDLDQKLANGEITQKQYDKSIKKLTKGNDKFLHDVATLAGARGLSGMLAIMNASDEDFEKLTESILHCNGATAKMAATMLDNAKGAITIFKSALEGLGITLWTSVAPAFTRIIKKATNMVDTFRKLDKRVQLGSIKWGVFAASLGPVLTVAGGLIAALPKIATALSMMTSPLGIVIGALALFAITAMDTNEDMTAAFDKMATSATNSLRDLNAGLGDSIANISAQMPKVGALLKKSLHKLIPEAMKTITTLVEGLLQVVADNADTIMDIGTTIIEDILGGLSDAAPKLIPAAAGAVTKIFSTLIKNAPRLLTAAALLGLKIVTGILETDWIGLATDLLTSIKDAFTSSADSAKTIGDTIIGLINDNLTAENVTALLTNATTFVTSLFDTIISAFSGGEGDAGTVGTDVLGKIVKALNTAFSSITGTEFAGKLGGLATAIINGIVDSITTLGTAGGSILTTIVTGISTMLGNITATDFANVDGVAQAIMNAISTGISSIGSNAKEIVTSIGEAIGSLLGTIGSETFTEGAGQLAKTLITGLGTAIAGAFNNAADIVNAITELLSGAMEEGSSANIGENLASLGTTIIEAIVNAIKGAAGGAANLITAIGDMISTALSGNTIGDLSAFGQAILSAIINGIYGVLDAGAQIATALGTALSGIDWAKAGVDLTNLVLGLITKLAEGFSGQNFAEVMTAIGTGLGTAVGSLATFAQGIAGALVDFLLSADNWAALGEGLLGIIEGAVSGVLAFMDGVVEAMGLKVETIEDQIRTINGIDSVLRFDTTGMINVEYTFANASKEDRDDVAQWLQEAGIIEDGWTIDSNGFVNYTLTPEYEEAELFGKNQPEYQAFVNRLKEMLEGSDPVEVDVPVEPAVTGGDGGAGGDGDTGGVIDQIKEDITTDAAAAGGVPVDMPVIANVTSVTEGEGTDIQSAAQEAFNAAMEKANIPVNMAVTANVDISVGTSNAASIGASVGTDVTTSMATAISGGSGQLTTAVNSIVNTLNQKLNEAAGKAFTAGANFSNGLRLGILSKASEIAEAAAKVVRDAIAAANAAQDSGSPSKVMKKVGGWYGEGYAIGIREQIRNVKRTATGMASAAIDALSVRPNATPAFAMAGSQSSRESIDYDRLAYAMSQQPAPVLDLDGKRVAEVNRENTAQAQNSRTRNISMRYGNPQ